jgi:hypothetical protein
MLTRTYIFNAGLLLVIQKVWAKYYVITKWKWTMEAASLALVCQSNGSISSIGEKISKNGMGIITINTLGDEQKNIFSLKHLTDTLMAEVHAP